MNTNSGGTISLVGDDASNFTINSEGKVIGNLNYNCNIKYMLDIEKKL